MTLKLVSAAVALAVIGVILSSGSFKGERAVASANSAMATASPVSGVCSTEFVKNVRVKHLGNNEFEVNWEYTAPDPCMKPDGFEVVASVKRKIGGGILGQKTIKAGPSDRRAIFGFGSVFGLDQITVSVKSTITLRSFNTAGLDL